MQVLNKKKVQALDMNDKGAYFLDTYSSMTHGSMRTHVCKLLHEIYSVHFVFSLDP